MKLPEMPSHVIAEQGKTKQSEKITKSIDNQTEVLLSELKRQTDLQGKQLDNQAIKITQLDDLINEARRNGESSSHEAKKSHWVSIISIVIAIASLIVAIIK